MLILIILFLIAGGLLVTGIIIAAISIFTVAESPGKVHITPAPATIITVSKEFARSQLIGGERFLISYAHQLQILAADKTFMQFITNLRAQLAGQELSNTKTANRRIADYFYHNHANELFPEVKQIVLGVISYGKQASAHISIYYAMFLYET